MDQKIMQEDWGQIQKDMLRACSLGRRVLLKYFGKLKKIENKFQAGLVSEADRASEEIMTQFLKSKYPHVEMLGEESAYAGQKIKGKRGGSTGRWILDPLDGTTNYIHRFPIFCISLALEVNSELKVAVVDVPVLDEIYTAIRGRGAYLNQEKIKVSKTKTLEKSLLATGFFDEDHDLLNDQLKIFCDMIKKCRGIRRAGSAAYDLCLVAQGVFDAYWEQNLKPWDTAAGQLILEEAGGKLITYSGSPYHPYEKTVIAGNPNIALQVQKSVKVLV